jgi:peptidoglycan/LPS O-acetylase OafA/YrhL
MTTAPLTDVLPAVDRADAARTGPVPPHDLWGVLAAVRFALATVVVAYHFVPNLRATDYLSTHLAALDGGSAVFCFLVISGFSIAHSLARRPRGFYARRFVRIYPLYLLSLATTVWVEVTLGLWRPPEPRAAAGSLVFLQTFAVRSPGGNPVLWTLAVEVALYAAAPLLARLSTRVLLAAAAASAGLFLLTWPEFHLPAFGESTPFVPLLTNAWAWLAGFAFYRARHRPGAGLLLVAAITVVATFEPVRPRNGSVTVVLAMVAVAGGSAVRLRPAARRAADLLGEVSYPLYLFHVPVLLACKGYDRQLSVWPAIGVATAVAVVAVAIDRALRTPIAAVVGRITRAGRGR